jgi:lysozyme
MSLGSPLDNQFIALSKSIQAHEGLRLKTYHCSEGKPTIGYGRNLLELEITEDQAIRWLHEDILKAEKELDRAMKGWREHSEARQNVLLEITFQMGMPRFMGFLRFWQAMREKDYNKASQELLGSRWAHQTPKRAHVLAKRMEMDTLQ